MERGAVAIRRKKMRKDSEETPGLFNFILTGVIFVLGTLAACYFYFGWGCKIEGAFSEDKYCFDANANNYVYILPDWQIGSYSADKERAKESQARYEEEQRRNKEIQDCYNRGIDSIEQYDIIKDYNLTCAKLQYINDHLIDSTRKESAGYIDGHYSGFLSSGSIKGESYQYITERVLATGQLVQNMTYHTDCNFIRSNIKVDYYSEAEFVMYYVDRCIEEKK